MRADHNLIITVPGRVRCASRVAGNPRLKSLSWGEVLVSDVLILSRRADGGVRVASEVLKYLGRRPILISDLADDPLRGRCAAHLVVDWDVLGIDELSAALDEADVAPTGVVNMVESLIGWQVRISRHFGLPGAIPVREMVSDKALVRAEMRRLGLSEIGFVTGPVGAIDVAGVRSYPAIVKPTRDSGASRLVSRADDPDELRAHLRTLAQSEGEALEVIVEDYLDGIEFSVDGPIVAGQFVGLFSVEKPEHDDQRHHDAGLRIAPPQSPRVRRGVTDLAAMVSALCASIELSGLWLHVEGRVLADDRTELIEINARPGGGLYRTSIIRSCAIDPAWEAVNMALDDEYMTDCTDIEQADELLGLVPLDIQQAGRVVEATTWEEYRTIEGVIGGYTLKEFQVTSLHQENFYGEVLVSADTVPELALAARRVRAAFRATVQ